MHETWCKCYFYSCIYVYCLFCFKKKQIFFFLQIPFAGSLMLLTSCSRTPWVMTAYDCMMSISFLHVYVWLMFFIISAADAICSCIEAVNELFQDTLGYDCMEHDVSTISVCVCMTTVYSTQKKREFHYFSCRYYLQLHWSCWRTVPAHLGS